MQENKLATLFFQFTEKKKVKTTKVLYFVF